MGTQPTAATSAAGNTTQTLASTPAHVAAQSEQVEPISTVAAERLAEIKSAFATVEATNAVPPRTSAAGPTGPAPVGYKAPLLGRKSPDGSNATQLDGSAMKADPAPAASGTTEYVTRDEYDALLDRIVIFNNRSSQKI